MRSLSTLGGRVGLLAILAFGAAAAAAPGCLFPSYVFDEPEPSGSTGTGGSSTSSNTTTTSSTSSTTGTGGATSSSSASNGGGGATSSSSSSNGGGGATSSSSSGGGTEDCVNGVDDDNDGKADCADPKCAGVVSCVAPVPSMPVGWTGPFALYEGPAGGFMGCPPEYPDQGYQGNAGFQVGPTTCFNAPQNQCTCGAPTGEQCLLSTYWVGDSSCALGMFNCGTPDINFSPNSPWNGACVSSPYVQGGQATCGSNGGPNCDMGTAACNQAIVANGTTVTSGTCTPSPVVPKKPMPTWSTLGVACGSSAAITAKGCNGQFQCMAKPPQDFVAGLCIQHAGVTACPVGPFTNQHVFYTGTTPDTRDCTACSCSGSSGATCTANVKFFSDPGCTQNQISATINSNITCIDVPNNQYVYGRTATFSAPAGGSCTPSGGQPVGSIAPDPATATTFCCIP